MWVHISRVIFFHLNIFLYKCVKFNLEIHNSVSCLKFSSVQNVLLFSHVSTPRKPTTYFGHYNTSYSITIRIRWDSDTTVSLKAGGCRYQNWTLRQFWKRFFFLIIRTKSKFLRGWNIPQWGTSDFHDKTFPRICEF